MSIATTYIESQTEESSSETAWTTLLGRLNRLSVNRHFDAYDDVDWDSDELQLDPTDPRWELGEDEPLSRTAWYQAQPPETRARLGCEMIATKMKIGLEFESVLKRGLLEFASTLPNGSPEFRYTYHEVIEEAQHSLMFQEFVNRSGFDVGGLRPLDRAASRWIVVLGRLFPELFFIFVLGGEDPIDHVQRRELRSDRTMHPLLERIIRIHVTEEARHLSFARSYLRRNVPRLGSVRRSLLAVFAPLVLAGMSTMMLKPSSQLVARYKIPAAVITDAYDHNPAHRAETRVSLSKVRELCEELGLVSGPFSVLWRVLGLSGPA